MREEEGGRRQMAEERYVILENKALVTDTVNWLLRSLMRSQIKSSTINKNRCSITCRNDEL